MRRSSNVLLVNLSLSNLLMILNSIPSFLFMRDGVWEYGVYACTSSQFMAFFTISLSVATIMGVSLERYRVIVTPLAPKLKGWKMTKFLLLIWTLSSLVSLPPAAMSELLQIRELVEVYYNFTCVLFFIPRDVFVCIIVWPDGAQGVSSYDLGLIFLLSRQMQILLPLFSDTTCSSSSSPTSFLSSSCPTPIFASTYLSATR